jgi:hypothetical protein
MTLAEAQAHYQARVDLAKATELAAERYWRQVDPTDVARSWLALVPTLEAVVTRAQYQAAATADDYAMAALLAQDIDPTEVGAVAPQALAGLASDGRDLASLLVQPALTALSALSAGVDRGRAMASGLAALRMIVGTQVADAGRVADGVALTARPAATGYVRMLSPPSCARCVVLAGRRYRWSAGFARHPRCDCVHVPSHLLVAGDLLTSPKTYFSSLSTVEQDQVFGRAGARAIRDGANIGQVVNARSGMYTAGGRQLTRSGITRRGLYGGYRIDPETGKLVRRKKGSKVPPRLMPEEIYRQAADREEAIALLREHGYLTTPTVPKRASAREAPAPRVAPIAPAPAPTVRPTAPVALPARPEPPAPAKPAAPAIPTEAAPYHRDLAGLDDLSAAVRRVGSDATRSKLSGGVSATTELVELPDGTRLVAKRGMDWGDPDEVAESIRDQATAEQMSSLVGRTIGAPVVRVYRQSEDQVWMEWLPGQVIGDLPADKAAALVQGRDGQLIGLLDHLTANADRNSGNMMVSGDRLTGIDHGWSWGRHNLGETGPVIQDQANRPAGHYSRDRKWTDNPLTPADITRLRARLKALREDFELIGQGRWLDYSLSMVDQLAPHAKGTVDLIG